MCQTGLVTDHPMVFVPLMERSVYKFQKSTPLRRVKRQSKGHSQVRDLLLDPVDVRLFSLVQRVVRSLPFLNMTPLLIFSITHFGRLGRGKGGSPIDQTCHLMIIRSF